MYCAARDYLHVIQHWPAKKEAYIGLITCLIALKWYSEATEWLEYFCKTHPEYRYSKEVTVISEDLSEAKISASKSDKCEEPKESNEEKQLRLEAKDYDLRFIGHCNTTTDIKEANFLGILTIHKFFIFL